MKANHYQEGGESKAVAEPLSANLRASMLALLLDDMKNLTDEQRMRVVNLFASEFCIHCGSLHLPCYCTRDD